MRGLTSQLLECHVGCSCVPVRVVLVLAVDELSPSEATEQILASIKANTIKEYSYLESEYRA